MSPINGVDDHKAFFPINQDNNTGNQINGNFTVDNPIPDSAGDNRDFLTVFQTLLNRIEASGNNLPATTLQNDAGNGLSAIPGNQDQTEALLTILGELNQSGASPEAEQPANGLSNQKLFELLKLVGKNSPGQAPDVTFPRVITNYKLAMQNFRNAFDLPGVSTEDSNLKALKRLLDKDSGVIRSISGVNIQGVNPSQQEVIDYISEQCKQIGIPERLGLATAATESGMTQFNKDGTPCRNSNPDSTDWGIMQINDKSWGDTYDFDRIKSDWKYNVRAGLQILKASFSAAVENDEGNKGVNSSVENLSRAAYSGYNAGIHNIWRYRTSIDNAPQTKSYDVISNEGYDLRDLRFWDNYQKSI